MGWFEHQHYWRQSMEITVRSNPEELATSAIVLEDCRCGAVRTIEIKPGAAPIVRIAH